MPRIDSIDAWEIIDSRGRPTVAAKMVLDGVAGEVSVPSGASTGTAEAMELRDGDPKRYSGLGTTRAVANIRTIISKTIVGQRIEDQQSLDRMLLDLDGTANKSRLGGNTILAVSLAFARTLAAVQSVPLYQSLGKLVDIDKPRLPRLTINLFSGGKHAGGQVAIQDVLMVPLQKTIDEALAATHAVYYAAAKLTGKKYNVRALKADEGGLAPPFMSLEAMFDDAVEAMRVCDLEPGKDMAIAVDVASTHFYREGNYYLRGEPMSATQMRTQLKDWVNRWPIISVEDGLSEDDWLNWPLLRKDLGDKALTLGDDFLCTNPRRIERAVTANACNALLLKVNQIGTLTEASEAYRLARQAGWKVVVSARSGETEDNWLADLAVGWAADYIKVGSICQSERLAKYNRLLYIERELQEQK